VVPWRLTSDVEAYAERTSGLLTSSPAEHTVPLTVLREVRRGHRWSDEPMLFGWLEDDGEVRGAVFRTPPFELLLAVVPEDATTELVATLRAAGADVPGVNGDVAGVSRFTEAWTAATGEHGTTTLALDLYELGTLRHPEPLPAGLARAAEDADLQVAVRWYTAFQEETPSPSTDVLPLVRERMADRRLWLWVDEGGAPVSLAARTAAVAGVARIAPVYTPPEHRRHGYASAVTAACTADALTRDAERVVLYTDLADLSANAMYQRIGFRSIGGRRVVRFRRTSTAAG
jgi:predicted GNAT family acetyltransferase